MATEAKPTRLTAALDAFGRDEKKLSAGRLEHHRELLVALFGEETMGNPVRCRIEAQRVERALREIIEDVADPVDRRIAQAVFASEPEFYGMLVKERKAHAEKYGIGVSADQYAKRRPQIIRDVEAALPRVLAAQDADEVDRLSPTVPPAHAGWLYRYAQEALLCVEIWDSCARNAESHREFDGYFEAARAILTPRTNMADIGLWALALCHTSLLALERGAGRAFLGEDFFSPGSAWRARFFSVFSDQQVGEMQSALVRAAKNAMEQSLIAAGHVEPHPFIDQLRASEAGEIIRDRWRMLLTASDRDPYGEDRNGVRLPRPQDREQLDASLLSLCALMHARLPKGTWSLHDANTSKWLNATDVTRITLRECGMATDEGSAGDEIVDALRDVMDARPATDFYREVNGQT